MIETSISLSTQNHKYLDDLLAECRKNLRSVDEDLIRRAFALSVEAHKNNLRASGEPYFHHPYEVAMIVAREIPLDDISVASALLHDVVEDTEFELKDIREEFGDVIANIVDGATKISDIFESHEITEAESYRKLLLSMVNDIRVMLIKFADRLHNMRTLQYLSYERQQRLAKETLEIYAPFAHRFGLARIKWELEDLAFKYLNHEEYEHIARQIRAKRHEREAYIQRFVDGIEKQLKASGLKYTIEGRPKHIYSIYNKMEKRGKPLEEIYDLFAVRIILDTDNNNDCFLVYGIVTEIYKPIPERFKDYISVPKQNGYQSIHTTVIGPGGRKVEVQIRTRAMHEVAEKGVAAHWMYKESKTVLDKELENWITWVREIFEQRESSNPKDLLESFKLNLYQDEIYVFTPKGELKILPRGATPVDFAFEIHSNIGYHCIGAKVNGRIVPLNTLLRSGDQIEIITSKNQKPNPDWEQFVVSHKAKAHLRRFIREEIRKKADEGKEIWEKRTKRRKMHYSNDDLDKFIRSLHFADRQLFFAAIAEEKVDVDTLLEEFVIQLAPSTDKVITEDKSEDGNLFTKFVTTARDIVSGISVSGEKDHFLYQHAKCCNPIPGDEIIGFITTGEGIKIHRKDCKNILTLRLAESARIVEVTWPQSDEADYIAGIHISGEDRLGLLNDVTHAISSYQNTNIRSVTMDSKGSVFDGKIILYVKDVEHLKRIMEKLKRIPNVSTVERFSG
ncbi:MAG TPA: bifunctional (p)ppGpp synthetase/guanosine-3',5'-bis(diphosphate) 3'-pyrophosphohydrolase [Bacteroidota bacterium]|nr:bifunctional (p)ppGpp synthetase/guanosine-3',5'-bis(diphosphate) 3'-pyrophosphohydrolase [Bacteroidota bacterium]